MASDLSFVEFVVEGLDTDCAITQKRMFGEFGIYGGGILFSMICDNRLFVKPSGAGRAFVGDVVEAELAHWRWGGGSSAAERVGEDHSSRAAPAETEEADEERLEGVARNAEGRVSAMIKVRVFYPNTPDSTFDLDYYVNTHIPMVQGKLGAACTGVAVESVVGLQMRLPRTPRWVTSTSIPWIHSRARSAHTPKP